MLQRLPQISKDKIKRLTDCNSEIQKLLHNLAIKEKIHFYIIRHDNSQLHKLSVADIEGIYKSRPHSHHVILQSYQNSFPDFQNCNWDEVWVNEDDERKLLEKNSSTNIPEVLKHKTPLLEIVYKTIEKFWLDHDPNCPPKSDEIVRWICEQEADGKKVAARNASVIDTILRPTPLKSGGNKSRKKKEG